MSICPHSRHYIAQELIGIGSELLVHSATQSFFASSKCSGWRKSASVTQIWRLGELCIMQISAKKGFSLLHGTSFA
jgi:hypothetical protein